MKRGLGLLICLVVLLCLGIGSAEREENCAAAGIVSQVAGPYPGRGGSGSPSDDGRHHAGGHERENPGAVGPVCCRQAGSLKTGAWQMIHDSGYTILEMTLEFSKGKLVQRTVFDDWDKVAGLFVVPGEVPDKEASPRQSRCSQGLTEKTVTVDAGSGFPWRAASLARGEILCGLVLVHGSGPSDRNETVMMNAPSGSGLGLRPDGASPCCAMTSAPLSTVRS